MSNIRIKYKGLRLDNKGWVYGYYIQKQETTYCFKEDYDVNPDNTKHYILWDETTDWGLPNRHLIIDIDLILYVNLLESMTRIIKRFILMIL